MSTCVGDREVTTGERLLLQPSDSDCAWTYLYCEPTQHLCLAYTQLPEELDEEEGGGIPPEEDWDVPEVGVIEFSFGIIKVR
jgi:hypothetical protein